MAICRVCKIDKNESCFATYKHKPNGKIYTRTLCKTCQLVGNQKWCAENKEWVRDRGRAYYRKNKDKLNARRRELKLTETEDKTVIRAERQRKNYNKNRQSRLAYEKKQYEDKKEQKLAYAKEYRQQNKQKVNACNKAYYTKTPHYRLSMKMASRMRKSLHCGKNGRHWESLVDYTCRDLVVHLEQRFTTGMTWSNYGSWHIDHIRPVSSFSFASENDTEFRKCWSLDNLQPLWAVENLQKHNKWAGVA